MFFFFYFGISFADSVFSFWTLIGDDETKTLLKVYGLKGPFRKEKLLGVGIRLSNQLGFPTPNVCHLKSQRG